MSVAMPGDLIAKLIAEPENNGGAIAASKEVLQLLRSTGFSFFASEDRVNFVLIVFVVVSFYHHRNNYKFRKA